jgi:hypothetical protein
VKKPRLIRWLETRDWRFWGPILARLAVAGVGVASVVVGLHAAWNANSATTALIVGGVLVALALLFNSDLEELSAKFKDTGFTYRRRREELLAISETLTDVSTSEDKGADATAALTTIRAEIRELAESIEAQAQEDEPRMREAAEHARSNWLSKWKGSWSQQGIAPSPVRPPQPMYTFVSEPGHKFISVSFSGWVYDWRIRCTIISPQEQVSSRVFFGEVGMGTIRYWLRYPDDLPAALPLVPGTYEFRWTRVGRSSSRRGERGRLLLTDQVTLDADTLALETDDPMHAHSVSLEPLRTLGTDLG